MKRKDALTDLVEHVQAVKPVDLQTSPSKEREVINAQGETITLGQQIVEMVPSIIKRKLLELERRYKNGKGMK